jgi:FkbM family methyltransferase
MAVMKHVLARLNRPLFERTRCAKHNLLDLKYFRVRYKGAAAGYEVSTPSGVTLRFPHYPYLAFHDIEGYIRQGEWSLQPDMTVVDAGGCYGEFAIYAAKCVGPSGRVLMLEPDPANIAVASKVFAMNGNPPNLKIVPAGLWREPGKLRFNAGQDAQSAIDPGDNATAPGSAIEIDVHSLPSLVDKYRLTRLDFVKMDIEGAELEVIRATAALPPTLRPRYAIASYHIVDGRPTADSLPGLFARFGYRCEQGYPNHLTTWASPANSVSSARANV